MNASEIERRLNALIDELASIEHERWAHWQRYMHAQGKLQPDGSLVIPADLVRRWESQIQRAYADLSEVEKESDREQVRRVLPLIISALAVPK